jgi:hypothetical protein
MTRARSYYSACSYIRIDTQIQAVLLHPHLYPHIHHLVKTESHAVGLDIMVVLVEAVEDTKVGVPMF